MAQLLTASEIQEQLGQLSGWQQDGKKIYQTFQFKDFVAAIAFVNQLVDPAEAAGHHPDLEISYNKVTVSLTTHDSGGLTSKDFALAQEISQII
ncbi:4a-hydroxytetrahydrobiopterin dehydratase [Spirulina subsalsa FACHB-351]|uniref:Putative pterin-4-alpha-carbinolamine dehydratase n=1 Tax=Spirulina subsalsa FACHB-351 TaxID=234711 RepID=A0ABT3L1T4_9CYAN|nr:4a-hydroxytetrahydrobiopterin dehydratase [Spirulina subsalsa]MCW6035463.1 4a-hydroxytetrahydrobiopterin dehydratase [Spirulina subsalsa FACHB-351]